MSKPAKAVSLPRELLDGMLGILDELLTANPSGLSGVAIRIRLTNPSLPRPLMDRLLAEAIRKRRAQLGLHGELGVAYFPVFDRRETGGDL